MTRCLIMSMLLFLVDSLISTVGLRLPVEPPARSCPSSCCTPSSSFTTIDIGPCTDDDDPSHRFNDIVEDVTERETRALAASMAMEEIFRATSSSSSSINHHSVFEFENVQLELKQFVDVPAGNKDFSYVVAEAEDDGAAGHTGKVEEEVKSSAEGGTNQEGRPSKIAQIMGWASQSLKPQILQVMYGNDTAVVQLEQRKKSWPNYTLKALLFACAMLFSAFMNLSSSTSITIKILFEADIIVFFIINGVLYINLPDRGNALVCISCLLLQVALCLLTVPFNGCYAFAIFLVLCLILVVALLQPNLQHAVKKYVLPSFTTIDGDTQGDIGDQENDYMNHLFDISNGIATCGGLVTGILGYYSYMVGPVTAAGFFFFSTVLLGLYLMMVIAMRAVSTPHAACLAIVLKALLLLTVITASVSFIHHSSVRQ